MANTFQCLAQRSPIKIENLDICFRDVISLLARVFIFLIDIQYKSRLSSFGFWQTRLHLCYETLKRVFELF